MILIFISFLTYSYHPKPFVILSAYYTTTSHLFLVGLDIPLVHAWITFPIAVGLGICIGEVVKEETRKSFYLAHLVAIIFSTIPLAPTWIIFPTMFCAMAAICGYKRILAYAIPTLLITSIVSTQIGCAPVVSICTSALGLVPFAFLCELFPHEVPFDVV